MLLRAAAAGILLLTAPLGAARRDNVTASRFPLDPGEWRYFEIPVKEKGARLDVQFEIVAPPEGGGIRVRIFDAEQFRKFRAGQPHRAVGETSYQREGSWRARLADAGVYVVVIDHRAGDRERSRVEMQMALITGPEPENLPVQYASARRRLVVIGASVAGFLLIVGLSGRSLWRATRNRPSPPTPMWY